MKKNSKRNNLKTVLTLAAVIALVLLVLFSRGKNNSTVSADPVPQTTAQQENSGTYGNDLYLAPTEQPGPQETEKPAGTAGEKDTSNVSVRYGDPYTSRDEVAAYLHTYGELPPNYITKRDAEALGYVAEYGNLWEVTDRKSIGGDYFGNFENILPSKKGRKYFECDIDYRGKSRGAKRIVYSNDGLIYYTSDHYETFTLLYGEE